MKEKLRKLFASNTEQDEAHYTSDGIMFFNKQLAQAHANTRENKEVITVTRAEATQDETDADILEAIRKRKEEITRLVSVHEPEWKELTEREEALLEKLAKESPESESKPEPVTEAVEEKTTIETASAPEVNEGEAPVNTTTKNRKK